MSDENSNEFVDDFGRRMKRRVVRAETVKVCDARCKLSPDHKGWCEYDRIKIDPAPWGDNF